VKKRIAVLGAGPAGLSLALGLLRKHGNQFEIVVLDGEDTVGGITASFKSHGLMFDYGSHRLHPAASPEVYNEISQMLGNDLLKRPRNGRIRLLGRFVKFPLNPVDAAVHLPPQFMLGVLRDSLMKPFPRKKKAAETFATVLMEGLGKTISRRFYFPYAEKLWGLPPEKLAAEQARRRVATNSIAKMIKKGLSSLTGKAKAGGAFFYYPVNGFGAIAQGYSKALADLGGEQFLGRKIEKINIMEDRRFEIQAAGAGGRRESYSYDFVFSTIPLDNLAKIIFPAIPAHIKSAADRLHYRGMLFHYLILKTGQFTPFDAHYFPEKDFIFSRISEPKNYYDSRLPEGITGICSEIPCTAGYELWKLPDKEITRRVVSDLNTCGLKVHVPVMDAFVKRIPAVYPVYDMTFAQNFETVDRFFSALPNFVNLGRQALFVHDNAHHTLEMGMRAVECLNGELKWDEEKWQGFRERFKRNVVVD
jgi:protoporphyrinogen oxidase